MIVWCCAVPLIIDLLCAWGGSFLHLLSIKASPGGVAGEQSRWDKISCPPNQRATSKSQGAANREHEWWLRRMIMATIEHDIDDDDDDDDDDGDDDAAAAAAADDDDDDDL